MTGRLQVSETNPSTLPQINAGRKRRAQSIHRRVFRSNLPQAGSSQQFVHVVSDHQQPLDG